MSDRAQNNTTHHTGNARQEWQALVGTISFLSRLPCPGLQHEQPQLARGLLYFPVVGTIIGALAALCFIVANMLWPSSIAVLLTLCALILISGGFHEDGLADSADGLGGGWQREDKLRIMKDSRLGSYGALAMIMSLLLRFATLTSLPVSMVPLALICAHTLARWSALPLLRSTPYAGISDSKMETAAHSLSAGGRGYRFWLAGAYSLGLMLILLPVTTSLVSIAAIGLLLIFWRLHCLRQLDGITGDTLGAANQLVEITIYLVLLAHPQ